MALNAVVFSPDGSKIATGGKDQTVMIWKVEGPFVARYRSRRGPHQ